MAQRKQSNWSMISADNLSGSNKRSSISGQETRYSVSIPVDVIINILSRLPLKSIAQSRCVCKLWSSIARRPNYNLLFPAKSPDDPPRILFAFKVGSSLFFYSSPQHHQNNPDNNNNSSAIVATRHDINLGSDLQQLCRPVRGLVCSQHIGKNCSWAVVSNPITGESVTTPKLAIEGIHLKERVRGKADYCFGYDPIDKQFKVLRITRLCGSPEHKISFYAKYHVLTLGTGAWRKLQCSTLHYPLDENGICENGICINGVLFYPALVKHRKHMIVCFDVRSEKFGFVSVDDVLGLPIHRYSVLINYNGKLGVNFCDAACKHFELWVLEDATKHTWSKRVYVSPHASLNWDNYVRPAGMIGSGEIVLYRMYTHNPFNIFYYNLDKKIIRRVTFEVPVLEKFDHFGAFTFANYVEDVKLM
ncbi:hypothetical protein YC2023_004736 [Brassica napus]